VTNHPETHADSDLQLCQRLIVSAGVNRIVVQPSRLPHPSPNWKIGNLLTNSRVSPQGHLRWKNREVLTNSIRAADLAKLENRPLVDQRDPQSSPKKRTNRIAFHDE